MKGSDKILDYYRKKVDELIDNQSSDDLHEQMNHEEQDELWEEISTELDIGEVWNGISRDLEIVMPVNTSSGIIVKSIAVVLIILISLIPEEKAIMDSDVNQAVILIENSLNEQSEEHITIKPGDFDSGGQLHEDNSSPVLSSSFDISEDDNETSLEDITSTGFTEGAVIPLSNEDVTKVSAFSDMSDSNLVVFPKNIPIEKSSFQVTLIPVDMGIFKELYKTDFDRLKINDNSSISEFLLSKTDSRRFSVGLITLFKNTWLLNHETFNGLKSESLNSTMLVFSQDIGLSLNYSLNKNWFLQADGYLYSDTGQEYLEYIYGNYIRKKITLRYSTIALSLKNKFIGSGRFMDRYSVNLLAGPYLSFLHFANQKINTDIENVGSQYRKFDLGVRLGGEIELNLSDHVSVAPGLFVSLGIPNIYEGDGIIPGYLRRTHNGSAGFHFIIYYHFD